MSVINYKSMEFFKIKISIGILKSKIFPFKTKFESQKLYWNNSYYPINHDTYPYIVVSLGTRTDSSNSI